MHYTVLRVLRNATIITSQYIQNNNNCVTGIEWFMVNLFLGWMEHVWSQQSFYMIMACKFSSRIVSLHAMNTYWGSVVTAVLTLNLATRWRRMIKSRHNEKRQSPSLSECNDSSSCAAHSLVSILIMLSQSLQVPSHDQHTCNCGFLLLISAQCLSTNIHIRIKRLPNYYEARNVFLMMYVKVGRKKNPTQIYWNLG